jgi:hypothetical protein
MKHKGDFAGLFPRPAFKLMAEDADLARRHAGIVDHIKFLNTEPAGDIVAQVPGPMDEKSPWPETALKWLAGAE